MDGISLEAFDQGAAGEEADSFGVLNQEWCGLAIGVVSPNKGPSSCQGLRFYERPLANVPHLLHHPQWTFGEDAPRRLVNASQRLARVTQLLKCRTGGVFGESDLHFYPRL